MLTPQYVEILSSRRSALRSQLERILPDSRAFTLEVGSGHGHFLTAYATAHPEKLCIGVDLIGERVERALRKRDRARLTNLHFIQAEARLFLECLPGEARIGELFVLFPDPWPKLRHNKHRILQPAFLTSVARQAVVRCPLYFRTDFAPYFEAVRGDLGAHPDWEIVPDPWPFEYVTVFQQRAPAYHSLVARRKVHPL